MAGRPGRRNGIDRSDVSLRARLLAGMVVVSFVLVAAAVIVARTTQANLVDRVDQQLVSAGPFTSGAVGGPTQFYAYQVAGGTISGVLQPNVDAHLGAPAVTAGEAVHAARTRQPFTVGSRDGSGRFRMLALPLFARSVSHES